MRFSTLTSIYKKEKPHYLDIALKSIWEDQQLKPDEIVLVEDGLLTDELYAVIKKWQDIIGNEVIKTLKFEENHGLGYALNKGLKACTNEIVFRVDSDDICHENKFKVQMEFMESNPAIDIVGTWCWNINTEGEITGSKKFPLSHDDIYKVIWTCPLVHPTVVFRKSRIEAVGSYDETLRRRQDYDLWFRAASKGLRFANIPENLLYYRITDDYYKKNNFGAILDQAKIGVKGLRLVKGSRMAYIGVFAPTIRALFPKFIGKQIHRLISVFDPRNTEQ